MDVSDHFHATGTLPPIVQRLDAPQNQLWHGEEEINSSLYQKSKLIS
jgi:hypothetical protein